MEEGEPEHEGAADGVEPRVDRVEHLLEGRAAGSHVVVGLFLRLFLPTPNHLRPPKALLEGQLLAES